MKKSTSSHNKTPLKKRCEVDTILYLLSQDYTKAKIRKKLGLSTTALSNHLRRLEDQGYIERQGKYIIKVLSSSYKYPKVTKNQVHKRLNKRGHAHNFKIIFAKEDNLLNKPKVKHELELNNLKKLPFGSLKLTKDKNSIWINKRSLTIYSNNSYYSKNALHSKFRSLKDIDNLVIYLKDRFGFTGIYGIEIFREHYGLIFNKFAQWTLKKGRKLYVKDRGNKAILWVDQSRKDDIGLQEFEGKDPITINKADNYFDEHEKTNWQVTPEFVLNTMNGIQQNQLIFNRNMKSHLKVLNKIGDAIDELRKEIKK